MAKALRFEASPRHIEVPGPSPRISVIVPVLNEERRLASLLDALAAQSGLHEVIVVDGGSSDRTMAIAASSGRCRAIGGPQGRARQMNAGATAASGNVLLFLHADARLPPGAAGLITAALRDPRVVGGAFRVRTVPDGAAGWPARWLPLADLRSRYTRLPYGDQAIFVRRDAFKQAGRYPDQPLFEDLEFSRRLRRVGRTSTLRASVEVSGRRFMADPLRHAVLMNVLPVLYRLGVSVETLAGLYRPVR